MHGSAAESACFVSCHIGVKKGDRSLTVAARKAAERSHTNNVLTEVSS